MPLANITLLQPFNIDSFASFDFGNISVGNLKTDNLLYANGVARTFATSAQGAKADTAVQPGDLATVATTGSYTDLIDKPSLFDGEYVSLANKPALFDGTYANLTGKPSLFDGEYSSLANKPTLFSGSYLDLTNTPTLFDGEYSSLANTPSLSEVATTGSYADLLDLPDLFDGTYANLTGKPTLGTAAATDATAYATAAQGTKADTALQPADLTGYATESYVGNAVANLVASAPAALDTLNELANALGNDASFSTTVTTAIGNKLNTADFDSTADAWLGTKTTSDVAEGTNFYFTDTRANTAIDNKVTKTFVDNLSVVANIANIAYSVDVANVTGIGNIATINIDGNTSNVLYGNGVFASAPVTYANSNVESYLPTYTGNLTPGNIIISSDNLKLSGGTANYVLSTDGTGNLSWVEQAAGSTSSGGGESTITSVDTFTGNGVDTVFTLSVAPQNINQTFINYNGAWQLRSAYTLSGQEVTFSEAPADGSVIEVTTQMNVTSGSGNLTVRTYTADGVQTDYTVSEGVNATNILVTENGLLQTPVADYTVTGSTLTFTTAPGNNVKVQIRELGVAVATITPVGSNTQVLFNDVGSFGHSSHFTFNRTTSTLLATNITVSSKVNLSSVANVTITGGTTGQYLQTDGTGNLAWANVSAGTSSARNIINSYVFGS